MNVVSEEHSTLQFSQNTHPLYHKRGDWRLRMPGALFRCEVRVPGQPARRGAVRYVGEHVHFFVTNIHTISLLGGSKCIFSTNSRSSGQPKINAKTLFFYPPSLSPVIFATAKWWHLYCFAILGSTSIVIHSVKQHLLRNQPGSDAATSRDFLRERLQRAFTCANQLHWTAQKARMHYEQATQHDLKFQQKSSL